MPFIEYVFLATVVSVAAVPGFLVSRLPALDNRSIFVRLYVFFGIMLVSLPFASILILIFFFQVLGIDMLD